MGQKQGKSDEKEPNDIRRKLLVKYLPLHSFKVEPAAIQAGYSPAYARSRLHTILKNDVAYCERVAKLKAENLGIADDKVEALDTKLDNILDSPDLTITQALKAIELRYRRLGALQDKTIIETGDRERELTASQREHARKLARHLMKHPLPKESA